MYDSITSIDDIFVYCNRPDGFDAKLNNIDAKIDNLDAQLANIGAKFHALYGNTKYHRDDGMKGNVDAEHLETNTDDPNYEIYKVKTSIHKKPCVRMLDGPFSGNGKWLDCLVIIVVVVVVVVVAVFI
ncbi:hypothetical protein LZ32DRAFT_648733 [Colletotrichum eremochloae]|nr:hypothetical protein LZ32DRAFT_648733 [Colletotrichum eremochloae]